MVQRIERIEVTDVDLAHGQSDYTIFVRGTDGDPSGYAVLGVKSWTDMDTPIKVGDLLVGDFPDIDLPTT